MQLDDVTTFNENILLKISNNNKDIIICCIYRSPNSDLINDMKLYQTINRVTDKYKNVIIIGDFNYPHINWTNPTNNENLNNENLNTLELFLNCINDDFLIQKVSEPTRIRGAKTQNILDLIFTAEDMIDNIEYNEPIGDINHLVLEFEIPWNYSNKVNETTQYYYDSGDYEKLREFVKININQIKINNDTDINNVWLLFKKLLTEGVEKFVQKKMY